MPLIAAKASRSLPAKPSISEIRELAARKKSGSSFGPAIVKTLPADWPHEIATIGRLVKLDADYVLAFRVVFGSDEQVFRGWNFDNFHVGFNSATVSEFCNRQIRTLPSSGVKSVVVPFGAHGFIGCCHPLV